MINTVPVDNPAPSGGTVMTTPGCFLTSTLALYKCCISIVIFAGLCNKKLNIELAIVMHNDVSIVIHDVIFRLPKPIYPMYTEHTTCCYFYDRLLFVVIDWSTVNSMVRWHKKRAYSADDILKHIFFVEKVRISIEICIVCSHWQYTSNGSDTDLAPHMASFRSFQVKWIRPQPMRPMREDVTYVTTFVIDKDRSCVTWEDRARGRKPSKWL